MCPLPKVRQEANSMMRIRIHEFSVQNTMCPAYRVGKKKSSIITSDQETEAREKVLRRKGISTLKRVCGTNQVFFSHLFGIAGDVHLDSLILSSLKQLFSNSCSICLAILQVGSSPSSLIEQPPDSVKRPLLPGQVNVLSVYLEGRREGKEGEGRDGGGKGNRSQGKEKEIFLPIKNTMLLQYGLFSHLKKKKNDYRHLDGSVG